MDVWKLSALLKACTASRSLAQGKLLHAKSISLGLHRETNLCKPLLTFYLSFALFESARALLGAASDISLWNTVLATYSKSQHYINALHLFQKLLHLSRPTPDGYTYPSVLKACSGLGIMEVGKTIHANVLKSGFASDVVISSSLSGMYAKCNCFQSAINLFDEIVVKDVACWNTVMSCYYQSGQASKALELFEEMKSCGFQPDSVSYTTAFSSCARLADVGRGRRIHEELLASNYTLDVFVSSAVLDMYAKCGCLESAREVFEQIDDKSVVSWNSMIGGYSFRGDSYSCLELFSRMNAEGVVPSATTISNLLIACSRSSNLSHGKFIHAFLFRKQINVDIYVASSLLDLYFKCGNVGYAETILKGMPKENIVLWNVVISGYVAAGSYFRALDTFNDMKNYRVRPDAITFTSVLSACAQLSALEQGREIHKEISDRHLEANEIVMCALLDMYAKSGAVKDAKAVFDSLPYKDVVSCTSMIMAYGSHGQAYEALELFDEMQNIDAEPDQVTFLAVLSACSHAGLVDKGTYCFNQMICKYGLTPGIEHYSSLVDLLGRFGRLHEAYRILTSTHPISADAGLLGSLLSACSLHKNLEVGEEVARLLLDMDPDDHSTYIVLANMYSSAGKWDAVRKVRAKVKERGLKKKPGCSWVEVNKSIHQFFAKDDLHPQTELIYQWLGTLSQHMDREKSASLTDDLDMWMEV